MGRRYYLKQDIDECYTPHHFPLKDLTSAGKYEEQMKSIRKKEDDSYPNLFLYGCHIDGSAILGVSSPDALRYIFMHDALFPKFTPTYDILSQFIGMGLATMQTGEEWHKERKLLTPVFHFDRLAAGVPIITSKCERRLDETLSKLEKSGGSEVEEDVVELFSDITLRIISAYAFGDHVDFDTVRYAFNKALEPVDDYFVFALLMGGGLVEALPFSSTAHVRKHRQMIAEVVKGCIRQELDRKRKGEEGKKGDAFPSLLETVIGEATSENDTAAIERAVSEGMTFLFAGHETTSNLLAFTFSYLVRPEYAHIQEEVRKEAREVFKNGMITTKEAANSLQLSERVLKEALRLAPPASIIERYAKEDCVLDGKKVKRGTPLLLFLPNAQTDGRYWQNPDKFDPARFEPARLSSIPNFAYNPFSAGGRNCIGQKLALVEAKLILSLFLLKFEAKAVSSTPSPIYFSFTMKPHAFKMKVSKVEE
eukprot:CAMPEP_0113907168 /NCGR_PEP_ID=MMETSP0780_2-20120614/25295_1 /TAXON_ID=652834 /ORGANISM="Palpitomonas bilix" /LENGTH=479 /DNA_ID=CAMNT_0000902133 /DNA_START=196 /DNA_END=1635 /DNA_ORIENTATION=+ /assembly_acc=CAM_ASM_000599